MLFNEDYTYFTVERRIIMKLVFVKTCPNFKGYKSCKNQKFLEEFIASGMDFAKVEIILKGYRTTAQSL